MEAFDTKDRHYRLSVSLQKAAMFTFVAAQQIKQVKQPVRTWKELDIFLHAVSEADVLSLINLVRDQGSDMTYEDKKILLGKYSFMKEESNSGFVKILTTAFGQIDKADLETMKRPLPEDQSTTQLTINRKAQSKAQAGFSHSTLENGPDSAYLKQYSL